MSSILRRPSIVVAAWAVLVLGLFVARGDLGLERSSEAVQARNQATGKDGGPVVVRRANSPGRLPRATRAGSVYDAMGFRLVGAEVVPTNGETCRTAADGAFETELVRAEISDLLVRAEGHRATWLRTTAVAPNPLFVLLEPTAPWDTEPQPPAPAPRLRGEGIVLGTDGQPLANAFVNVAGTQCWGCTDDIGRLELPLPAGTASFLISRPGGGANSAIAALSSDFVATRQRGIVPLPALVGAIGGTIRGTVRDPNGKGVSGLPVEVRGNDMQLFASTGTGGAFTVSGLLPDDYVVEPFPSRGALAEPVQVRVDRAVVACDVQLQNVEQAELKVVDEHGAAASGVWVATSLFGHRRGVGRVDPVGFVSLPVAGSSEFEVRTSGNHAHCTVQSFEADAEPPTLTIVQP